MNERKTMQSENLSTAAASHAAMDAVKNVIAALPPMVKQTLARHWGNQPLEARIQVLDDGDEGVGRVWTTNGRTLCIEYPLWFRLEELEDAVANELAFAYLVVHLGIDEAHQHRLFIPAIVRIWRNEAAPRWLQSVQ